jgi:hypothetical protein
MRLNVSFTNRLRLILSYTNIQRLIVIETDTPDVASYSSAYSSSYEGGI